MKKFIKILMVMFLTSPVLVSAQGIKNPIKVDSIEAFIDKLLDIIVQLGVIVVVLAIIYSGFLFVMARGNPEELNKAKRAFLWSVIGGIVLLGAKVISEVVKDTAGELKSSLPVIMPMIGIIYKDKFKKK